MLDALKMMGATGKAQKSAADELQALINTAREERSALSEMLTQVTARGGKLGQTNKNLEAVEKTAAGASARVDELAGRLQTIDERARRMEDVELRINALLESVKEAQTATERIVGPEGDLQQHRDAVKQLASQTLDTQARLDALMGERPALEDLRADLRTTHTEVRASIDETQALKAELEQARSAAAVLDQEYARIREAARTAREHSGAAIDAVKDIESKLVPLNELHELSKTTEERLGSLNALAEHVAHKAKALESQKHTIDRALVETNRLNEMVWAMEAQMTKLNEGTKQIALTEEMLGRIEKLALDTTAQIDTATNAKDELARNLTRFENEGRTMVDSLRSSVEQLTLERKAFDAFDCRVRALRESIGGAEQRVDALTAKDAVLAQLDQRVATLSTQFERLFAQNDELAAKQESLEALQPRLAQVDELSARTAAQMSVLTDSRRDLQTLRQEMVDFRKSFAEAASLRDRLGSDRQALEGFIEKVTALGARTPAIEAKIDELQAKFGVVEEASATAARVEQLATDLDSQLNCITGRVQFVEQVDARINGLAGVLAGVDGQLAEQLARRAEVERLKDQIETIVSLTADTQQKLDAAGAAQQKLLPMVPQVLALRSEIETAFARLKSVQREEAEIAEQEARLTDLADAARRISADVADRERQIQRLSEDLNRSTTTKEELLGELAQIEARRREALAQVEASDEQLARVQGLYAQAEQRRPLLASAERRLGGFESRVAELERLASQVDRQIDGISARQVLVEAVKAEVNSVHEIGVRTRADLQYVAEHRSEVMALKTTVDDMVSQVAETSEKMAIIAGQRKAVDEIEAKTQMITNLLDDVRVNLETFGEHKSQVDHLFEKLARLEFMTQEAQSTLKALQRERELAERIEHGIRQLRSRTLPKKTKELGN